LDKGGVLWGYYIIPKDLDQPIISVLNPQGNDLRRKPRVWNKGDRLLKFLVLKSARGGWERPQQQGQQQSNQDISSSSIMLDQSKEATSAAAAVTIAATVPPVATRAAAAT